MTGFFRLQPRARNLAIATIGLAIGVLAALVSIANIFREANPELVLRLSPFTGRASAALAVRQANAIATGGRAGAAVPLAVNALLADPTASGAATALGIAYALRGKEVAADRAIHYAEHLSRRDTITQLWLIERAVARGDVPGALRHYDLLLRRVAQLRPSLYPILVGAATQPEVARALRTLLLRRANWTTEFVGQFAYQQKDPVALDAVTRGYLNLRVPAERAIFSVVLNRLAELGRPDLAWQRYRAAGGNDSGAIVRDPRFAEPDPLAPFGWSYAKDDSSPDRGLLSGTDDRVMYIPIGLTGDVDLARQLLRVGPGRYELTARSGEIAGGEGERPVIRLECAATKAVIAMITLPPGDSGSKGTRAGFGVPGGCNYIWLTVRARNILDDVATDPGWLTDVSVHRAG